MSRIDPYVKSNRMLALGAAMAAAVVIGAGCAGSKSPGAGDGTAGSAQVSAALDLANGVHHVTLTISGPSSRTQGLEKVSDTHYQTTVTALAAGSGYAFLVQGFDASDRVVLSGQADVIIEAGRTAQVNIILHEPTAPTGERRRLPVLDGISASTALVPQNSPVAVSVTAHSPEDHALGYEWSDDCGGHFADATAISTTWTSPGVSGTCQLSVRIIDAANATSVTGYLVVVVQAPTQTGHADVQATVDAYPVLSIGVVDEFVVFEEPAPAGRSLGITAVIQATASDPEGGVTHLWTATCDTGTSSFSPSASDLDVTFHNDSPNAVCTLTLTATDGSGQSIAGTIELSGFRCANVTCDPGEVCDPTDGQCRATGTYEISGTMSGAVQDGVLITLGGDANATAVTAGGGHFSFTGLANGSYTLTPSMAGYAFTPASITVTVDGSDVASQDFASSPASSSCIFIDDFETGLGPWSASNGVWEVGAPTSGPNACFSGTSCAATVLDGNYPNTNSSLVSPPFTLPSIAANQEIHLRFWNWFSFDGGDGGGVYIQEQTSPGVWSAAVSLASYSGTSGGVWTRPTVDLSAYAGKRVRILFGLVTAYSGVSAGWYIDDVSVCVVEAGASVPFAEGFESGLGEWWASNGSWQVGSPTAGPASCHGGIRCAATVLDGNYPNTNTSLVSPSITLPVMGANEEIHLRFWHWFSFDGGDEGGVYIQEQTSPGVWSAEVSLASYSGTSGGVWTRPMVDLSAYAGKRVRILFGLVTAYSGVSAGWYIDDVSVAVVPAGNSLPYADGFEAGLGNWWASNGSWQVGSPTTGPASCHDGTTCAATVLDGNYPNTNTSLVSPSISLPVLGAGEEIQLRSWHWFSFDGGDGGGVYIQEQTSPGVWSAAVSLASYSGTSGGVWTRPMVDLSAYAGKRVRILFGLVTAYSGVSTGWYIDDVSIALSP